MEIRMIKAPDSLETAALLELEKQCLSYEPLTLSLPVHEADFLVAAFDVTENKTAGTALKADGISLAALGAAAFLHIGDSWECAAFTAPRMRRQGIFTALLEAGLAALPEDEELYFYIDGNSEGALSAAEAMGFEFLCEEHMMELSLEEFADEETSIAHRDDSISCMQDTREDGTPLLLFAGFHGSVIIALESGFFYLYDMEIEEKYRGQGLGKKLLGTVLYSLCRFKKGSPAPANVRLQVSGENAPALALYKKTGFRITETLSCYLY